VKFLDEYRDGASAAKLVRAIAETATRPWTIMEVCGGQTHTIVKYGIDELVPPGIELVHGPGCPVCVTSLETIDRAHAIASHPGVIFCSFGDMLRVPGSRGDLLQLKSHGADIRIVYSPLDAVAIAAGNPGRQVVFFAIGFEPLDMLEGLLWTVRQLEEGRAEVENPYARAVRREGNLASRRLIDEVFEVCDRKWRGVGSIPKSGLKLRYEYRQHDAAHRFDVDAIETEEPAVCISGDVLRGLRKPHQCPAFGKACTPESPLGATMVSAEGACAAYYAYGRYRHATAAEAG